MVYDAEKLMAAGRVSDNGITNQWINQSYSIVCFNPNILQGNIGQWLHDAMSAYTFSVEIVPVYVHVKNILTY